jgi:hypothetical protein
MTIEGLRDAQRTVRTCPDDDCAGHQDYFEPVPGPLAEIQDRYGPGHLVSRSIQRATPMILGAVKQVHDRAAHIA